MPTMTRDPAYIADQVRWLRQFHKLKQQNLADITGLSTRTIEKVESGRHTPDEQTLKSIARALGMEGTSFFNKPTEEERQRQRADLERAIRKTIILPLSRVETVHDVIGLMTGSQMYHFDMSSLTGDAAVDTAAGINDWIKDYDLFWADISATERVAAAREFLVMCSEMEKHGFTCYTGRYRQQRTEPEGKRWVTAVLLLTFLAKGPGETPRFAMVQLQGPWETLEKDRLRAQGK